MGGVHDLLVPDVREEADGLGLAARGAKVELVGGGRRGGGHGGGDDRVAEWRGSWAAT